MAIMKSLTIGNFTGEIPSKTSDLTNDSGFVDAAGAAAAAPVQSVNGKTGAVVLDATDVGALTEADLIALLPVDTASGPIASFPDGADNVPVEALTVGIAPVQSGSGDPSPTNIRPISGHTSVTVTRTGANVLPLKDGTYAIGATGVTVTITDGIMNISGTASSNGGRTTKLTNDFLLKAGTYYIATNRTNDEAFYINNAATNAAINTGDNRTFTLAADTLVYGGINVTGGKTYDGTPKPMVNVGSSALPYEPYSGISVTIDLSGTRYGGTLDVLTGVLTVDKVSVDLATAAASKGGTGSSARWTYTLDGLKPTTSGGEYPHAIAEQYKGVTSNQYNFVYGTFYNPLNSQKLEVVNSDTVNKPQGIVVYELASPLTIQLDANTLATLLGTNNVWSSANGDTSVTYRANIQKYIQKLVGA